MPDKAPEVTGLMRFAPEGMRLFGFVPEGTRLLFVMYSPT